MNINLATAAAKQHIKNNNRSQRSFIETNKKLSYGLNNRKGNHDGSLSSKTETGGKKKKNPYLILITVIAIRAKIEVLKIQITIGEK